MLLPADGPNMVPFLGGDGERAPSFDVNSSASKAADVSVRVRRNSLYVGTVCNVFSFLLIISDHLVSDGKTKNLKDGEGSVSDHQQDH